MDEFNRLHRAFWRHAEDRCYFWKKWKRLRDNFLGSHTRAFVLFIMSCSCLSFLIYIFLFFIWYVLCRFLLFNLMKLYSKLPSTVLSAVSACGIGIEAWSSTHSAWGRNITDRTFISNVWRIEGIIGWNRNPYPRCFTSWRSWFLILEFYRRNKGCWHL